MNGQATTVNESLAARLAADRPVLAVGVFDALSAVIAEQTGFEALFLSGSSLALTQLARPDVGLLTLTELADATSRICERVTVPLLVDADHGFGNALNVSRAVRTLERAGASGIQLEDRVEAVLPKHISERPVVAVTTLVDKIRAAVDARVSATTVISARTDAMYSHGLSAAIERAQRCIEAGADMVFVEGCKSADDRRAVVEALAGQRPVLFNTSIMPAEAIPAYEVLAAAGYAVILFPGIAASAAGGAVQTTLDRLQGWAAGGELPRSDFNAATVIGTAAFLKPFS
ncbi:MAG: isocitrate lyase/PEP mutase family protein [Gammaproteobacteria bacterium]|nr:isocitrate lyase/PEP mutase family protein [Gammaproteobacteria bacterium]